MDQWLDRILTVIQEDIGGRGLRTDPRENLVSATVGDFHAACASLAQAPHPSVGIVTGFLIPHADPPAGETDGPLGAIFLARSFVSIGFRVSLITDGFCQQALHVGLKAVGCQTEVPIHVLPNEINACRSSIEHLFSCGFTHFIALERVGPSYTPMAIQNQIGSTETDIEAFLHKVPSQHHNRAHTMRGRDITDLMAPAHLLFESPGTATTIGIGDGGNEIGMGKIPWRVIDRNIPNGGLVACRVATRHLIVCGVSNWGAYGLAAGVMLLRGRPLEPALISPEVERHILSKMVEQGPLVDGVTGKPTVTVDGLPFDKYIRPLTDIAAICNR